MRYMLCFLLLFLLPAAFADLEVIETDFDIRIFSGDNASQGYIYIVTEDDEFNYTTNQNNSYTEEIQIVRDIKCKEEELNDICLNISKQHITLLDNLKYINKYQNCDTSRAKVSTEKDFFQSLYADANSSLITCNSERSNLQSQLSSCQTGRSDMFTKDQCEQQVEQGKEGMTSWTTVLVILGGAGLLWWNYEKKRKGKTPDVEERASLKKLKGI